MTLSKSIVGIMLSMWLSCALNVHAKVRHVDEKRAVVADTDIEIHNMRGKVEIIGTERNDVWVKGQLDQEALDFIFDVDANKVSILVKMPSRLTHQRLSEKLQTNLVIELPKQAKVRFKGIATDVTVYDVNGQTELSTVSGNVVARNLANDVQINTVSGDINATELVGSISLSSVSGAIVDKQSSGDLTYQVVSGKLESSCQCEQVKASIVSGSAKLQLHDVRDADISTVSGDASLRVSILDDGLLNLSTVSGDIKLALPNDVDADIKAYSHADGKIINNISNDKAQQTKRGPVSKFRTRLGDGRAIIKASSISGDMTFSYQ